MESPYSGFGFQGSSSPQSPMTSAATSRCCGPGDCLRAPRVCRLMQVLNRISGAKLTSMPTPPH